MSRPNTGINSEQIQTRSKTVERKNLTVISVDSPKPVGEKGILKLQFKAKDGEKDLSYFTFRNILFETIQNSIGQIIDAEVETSSREHEGNTYTDRKVSQIFIDGEPLARKISASGSRGSNPEERASIEAQCAFKIIAELRIADKLPESSPLYHNLLSWLHLKTTVALESTSSKVESDADVKDQSLPVRRNFTNVGQFLTAANKELRLNKTEVLFKLKVSDLAGIKDFSAAWEILNDRKQGG